MIASKTEMLQKLPWRPELFWDTDIESLDPEKHSGFIISRIVEYGDYDDVKNLFRVYPRSTIREALMNSRSLGKKTISFFASYFGVDRSCFRSVRESSDTWTR